VILIPAVAAVLAGQISNDRLLHPEREPQNWLHYSGDYSSERYSLLDKITPGNVKNLELKWIFQARSLEKFETTPLVIDGIMYFTEAPDHAYAVDAVARRAGVLRICESRAGGVGRPALYGNHRRPADRD
jgi:glucose dehydrogenase